MTDKEREKITRAMEVLEAASVGGIGSGGPTIQEMEQDWWQYGQMSENDAYYDTCQHAWRLLEEVTQDDQAISID